MRPLPKNNLQSSFANFLGGLRPPKSATADEGGVYLKISEQISLTGSAGGIPPKPPFRPPRLEAEAKRQTTKEPEKMSARTLFWPEAGFLNFY